MHVWIVVGAGQDRVEGVRLTRGDPRAGGSDRPVGNRRTRLRDGLWIHAHVFEVVELAVEAHQGFGPGQLVDLDAFLRHRESVLEGLVNRVEFFFHPAGAHPEEQTPSREVVEGPPLACVTEGVSVGSDQHSGTELDPARSRGNRSKTRHRIEDVGSGGKVASTSADVLFTRASLADFFVRVAIDVDR